MTPVEMQMSGRDADGNEPPAAVAHHPVNDPPDHVSYELLIDLSRLLCLTEAALPAIRASPGGY